MVDAKFIMRKLQKRLRARLRDRKNSFELSTAGLHEDIVAVALVRMKRLRLYGDVMRKTEEVGIKQVPGNVG